MQKPEWFRLDAAKFLADSQVDAMSTLELGACLRLLCRQWIDGSIPDDPRMLARLCRLDPEAMGQAWVTLAPFFPPIASGKRANRYMWQEREKVVAALLRKSDEGTKAARKRWDEVKKCLEDPGPNESLIAHPMQDQRRPEQTGVEKISSSEQGSRSDLVTVLAKKAKTALSREAVELAALLKGEILRNKCDFKITQSQERSWAITADRMLRIDCRNPEEAAALIRWAQRDEFWMANVLSMPTFRKQYDKLALKARGRVIRAFPAPVPLPSSYVSASEEIRRERAEAGR